MYKYQQAVDLFLKIVQIDSPSLEEKAMCDFIENYAKENWKDAVVTVDEIHLGDLPEDVRSRLPEKDREAVTHQVYVEIPANTEGKPSILLGAHVDTVSPGKGVKPSITEDGKIITDGTTVLGSDDKAGVAGIITAIDELYKNNLPHGRIMCVFTACEEKGLLGARLAPVDKMNLDYGYVFDTTGRVGEIVERVQHSQTVEINVKVSDIPNHAYALTVQNALGVASEIIARLPKGLWDKGEYTLSNVTSLKTETEPGYLVPNKATVKFSIRSFIPEELKVLRDMFGKLISAMSFENTEITYKISLEKTMGYDNTQSETGRKMMSDAAEAIKELGIQPKYLRDGLGGHDASIYRVNGVPSLVLSCGMQDIHTTREWCYAEDVSLTVELILKLIEKA